MPKDKINEKFRIDHLKEHREKHTLEMHDLQVIIDEYTKLIEDLQNRGDFVGANYIQKKKNTAQKKLEDVRHALIDINVFPIE